MLCFASNSKPSFFLFLFGLFLFFTSAFINSLSLPDGQKQHEEVVAWDTWRSMAEANSTLVLAEERTRREDIFDHFQLYTGGWNISDRHYLTSVLSTAVPLFAVAVAWFVIFGAFLFFFCACYCCCNREPNGYSKSVLALSLIFLTLCTIATIGGCVALYTGQREFRGSTWETLDYIASQAQLVTENLRNVSSYFNSAKQIVNGIPLIRPLHLENDIDSVNTKITNAADLISNKTEGNYNLIHRVIDGVTVALIVVTAVMLFLTFIGFLFSLLELECLVYFLTVFGWIFVAGTFILCGTFLFVHNVIADTCVAMDEWVVNPTAHTALDEILPCVENATASEAFLRSKVVTYQIVESFDGIISALSNRNQNKYSASPVPLLCNPFNSDYTPRQCAPGEVTFQNATEVWRNYICQVSPSGICTTLGGLTPTIYTDLVNAVNVANGLFYHVPFLVDLEDCTFVRKTFANISSSYCSDLRKYTKWIYFGLLVVSVAVMLSLIFWIVYVRERYRRRRTKWYL